MRHALLQSALAVVYPSECALCRAPVGSDFGLCPNCLMDTPFISGPICDTCGIPVLSEVEPGGTIKCDDCVALARPWDRARAVLRYTKSGRKIVLALKHGDRLDLLRTVRPWVARAAGQFGLENAVVLPVPLHPWRQIRRRYNQSSELARGLAADLGFTLLPGVLRRTRATPSLDHRTREDRMNVMRGAVEAEKDTLKGASVLLVDDVMTSGATLAAATEAAFSAGARTVDCLVLARVEKDDPAL